MWPDVSFEYKGKTALTVRGNISGKNYRFSRPGDIQQIDYRDAPSMMRIGALMKVNKKQIEKEIVFFLAFYVKMAKFYLYYETIVASESAAISPILSPNPAETILQALYESESASLRIWFLIDVSSNV